jgi:hypothetical protein
MNVSGLVMAFPGMTSHDRNTIRTLSERFQNHPGLKPAGTHHPDNIKIGWNDHSGSAQGICTFIRAPVAQKADNPGLKPVCHDSSEVIFWPLQYRISNLRFEIRPRMQGNQSCCPQHSVLPAFIRDTGAPFGYALPCDSEHVWK